MQRRSTTLKRFQKHSLSQGRVSNQLLRVSDLGLGREEARASEGGEKLESGERDGPIARMDGQDCTQDLRQTSAKQNNINMKGKNHII